MNCSDDNDETVEVPTLNERVFADSEAETDEAENLIDESAVTERTRTGVAAVVLLAVTGRPAHSRAVRGKRRVRQRLQLRADESYRQELRRLDQHGESG